MSRSLIAAVLGLAMAAVRLHGTSSPTLAHHGGGVEYFMDQTRGPLTGVVTSFSFSFPHPYIQFDVKDETGTVQKWSAVMQLTPTRLRARGWTRDSVKPGDTLTVTYSPHRTAPNVGFARRLVVNGKFLDEGV
jgi:Family of unknown function (DUF6152)